MTFISEAFGTAKTVRKTLGFEPENNMITDMIFIITMVLWKKICEQFKDRSRKANK